MLAQRWPRFAFEYLHQFFFALAFGVIALNRVDDVLAPDQYSPKKPNDLRNL